MDRGKRFEVLEGLKIILKFVEIYPGNLYFRKIQIPIPLILRSFIALLFLFLITSTWLCISFEWNLSLISGPICFLFGDFIIIITYFSMLHLKSIIVESTDLLQELVQQRKLLSL